MSSQTSDSQSNRHKADKMLLAIAVIIVVITATVLAISFMQSEIHPYPTPALEIIVNGNLTVNASSYEYYDFTVSIHISPTVQGTFTVSSGEKIRVYIMDSANFTDWQNKRPARMYYDSGESSSGNVTATLPSGGNYVLVYDNTFSATSKKVTTQVYGWHI
jgi:hypothetical protein